MNTRAPSRLTTALTLMVFLLGVVTVMGLLGRWHALFELVTNVTHLLALVAAVTAVVAALTRRWWQSGVALVIALWFMALVVPYLTPSPDPVPADGVGVRALQYNVHFDNAAIASIVERIESTNADVVVLHEITTLQWARLQPSLTGFPHSIAEPWDGPEPQLGGGMALLSRTPLDRIDVGADASIVGRPILAASTRIGGRDLVVVGLHPHASRFDGAKVGLRERQIDAVVELLALETRPAIVLTDLNMTPTSSSYRSMLDRLGWRDPHHLTGWDATWPQWRHWTNLPIDHILVSNDIAVHEIDSLPGAGSDHRALFARLSIRPAGAG